MTQVSPKMTEYRKTRLEKLKNDGEGSQVKQQPQKKSGLDVRIAYNEIFNERFTFKFLLASMTDWLLPDTAGSATLCQSRHLMHDPKKESLPVPRKGYY